MVEKITISWDCSDRAKRRIFAGFKGINIRKDEAKHWLMVTAEK